MKAYLIFVVMILSVMSSKAQMFSAMIKDSDGFTNVRKSNSIKSDILFRIENYQIFEYSDDDYFEKKEWIRVSYNNSSNLDKRSSVSGENYIGGYMHRSRLLPLEKIYSRIPITHITRSNVTLENDSIKIKISKRNLSEFEIDSLYNLDLWGTDTGNPVNQIDLLQVEMNNQIIEIDCKYYSDLYHVNLDKSYAIIHNNCLIIGMSNSDGAGFYEVNWVFNKNKLIKRQISLGP